MVTQTRPPARSARGFARLSAALAVVAALPGLAIATLGADAASVVADGVKMKAMLATSSTSLYTVHEMQTAYGTFVRELVSPTGVVFAVTWKGPFLPDLRQTLGAYFSVYQTVSNAGNSGHSHRSLERADLVVRSTGHMRAFSGLAYVPGLVPAGVSVDQLQ